MRANAALEYTINGKSALLGKITEQAIVD